MVNCNFAHQCPYNLSGLSVLQMYISGLSTRTRHGNNILLAFGTLLLGGDAAKFGLKGASLFYECSVPVVHAGYRPRFTASV
jgi:hypothetical protein